MSSFYDTLRYRIIPPTFVLLFTGLTQVLVILGNPNKVLTPTSVFQSLFSLGNVFAWKVVTIMYGWAFVSLKVPAKTFLGPPAPHGYVPRYSANGTQYYLFTMTAFLIYCLFFGHTLCVDIYQNFAEILSVLNVTSLVLCCFLMLKGMVFPENTPLDPEVKECHRFPRPYLFYRGLELHPRVLGVDVKQWTNCRVSMMSWAILVTVFCLAGIQTHGFTPGPIVNALLINIYLLKFFYWETGYFTTLDITLDRAGYYLCWGCLCWVQAFYTFSAYYMVGNPSKVTDSEAFVILLFGLISTMLNYDCDRQKENFRATTGHCRIWGRKALFQEVAYKNNKGILVKSKLLLSGFWGLARHMNYVFEVMLAFSWSLPAIHYGMLPFAYVIFLTILLIHRTFRDEEKCSAKYGSGWQDYCQRVPYKFIPYLV